MLRKLFIIITFPLFCTMSKAGGFGIELGKSPSEYGCQAMSGSIGYFSCEAPKPHSAFEQYVVKASESHGICWIKGVGKDISDNGYGSSTLAKHAELKSVLSKAYGEISETTDFVLPGALWSEADEWLMAIDKKQRFYSVNWSDLKVPSKPKLKQIYLGVGATGNAKGWLTLEYYSKDYEDCKTAVSQSESGSL